MKLTHVKGNTFKAICDANQLKLIDNIVDIANIKRIGVNKFTCEFKGSLDNSLTKIIVYLHRDEYEGLAYWQKYNIQYSCSRYIGSTTYEHNHKENIITNKKGYTIIKKLALNTDYIKNSEFWRYGYWSDSTHFNNIECKQGYFVCHSWEELWDLLFYVKDNYCTTYYNEVEDNYIHSQGDRFYDLSRDEIINKYTEDDYQELCKNFLGNDFVNRHIFFELTTDDFNGLKDDLKRGRKPNLSRFISDHKERENEWGLLDAENWLFF